MNQVLKSQFLGKGCCTSVSYVQAACKDSMVRELHADAFHIHYTVYIHLFMGKTAFPRKGSASSGDRSFLYSFYRWKTLFPRKQLFQILEWAKLIWIWSCFSFNSPNFFCHSLFIFSSMFCLGLQITVLFLNVNLSRRFLNRTGIYTL